MGGILDNTYLGEVHVILFNANTEAVKFESGDPIAQIIPYSVPDPEKFKMRELVYKVFQLENTDRGTKGFGEASAQNLMKK